MAALIAVGSMAGNIVGGVLVDRHDARTVLVASELVFVPATLALVLAGSMPQLLALGFQLWVNLPESHKWRPPRYQDLRGNQATLLTSPDAGGLLRLIAGDLAGCRGPGSTHTPMAMIHATLEPDAQLRLPWRRDFNALAYVLSGMGSVGAGHRPIHAGQLAVFGPGDVVTIAA